MLHLGHRPGSFEFTSGCIGQTYTIGSGPISCLAGSCANAKPERPAAANASPPAKNDLRLFVIAFNNTSFNPSSAQNNSLANRLEHTLLQLLHVFCNSARPGEERHRERKRDHWHGVKKRAL